MADIHSDAPTTRKTRIVCISDTHNQTPKLPKGDVLIHAGDLTNQGSYSELKKTVEWLEKADFEAKIVIAGNHDITLDTEFYHEQGCSFRYPEPQDLEKIRKLFDDSPSIIYLENQAATIYLNSPNGPHTCFKVFGSPCTPKKRAWAFQYEPKDASRLWGAIPSDTDIVITHAPPKGHCDTATTTDQLGCEVLLQALHRVRPVISVFGHIHEGRGAEIVRWNVDTPENGSLVEDVEVWADPGIGNSKQSLVNLTSKGRRPLDNSGVLTRCSFSLASHAPIGDDGQADATMVLQPDVLKSTSGPAGVADSEAKAKAMSGGAIVCRQAAPQSDIGLAAIGVDAEKNDVRRETAMINAAFLGPKGPKLDDGHRRQPKVTNKPIVVDVDLPVWRLKHDGVTSSI